MGGRTARADGAGGHRVDRPGRRHADTQSPRHHAAGDTDDHGADDHRADDDRADHDGAQDHDRTHDDGDRHHDSADDDRADHDRADDDGADDHRGHHDDPDYDGGDDVTGASLYA
jgi:hypothetical protein